MNSYEDFLFWIKKKVWISLKKSGIVKSRPILDAHNTYDKTFYNKKILSAADGNNLCYSLLLSESPCMISRIGTIEMGTINACIYKADGMIKKYKDTTKELIFSNAGFYGSGGGITDEELLRFLEIYSNALGDADVLGVFGSHSEDLFIHRFSKPEICLMQYCALEPYYFENPWSMALKGKRILVIHPFSESIEKQYNRRTDIFTNKDILPDFELFTIKAVQSIGGNTEYATWFDALEYMKDRIDSVDFDIALIGCGAYGFPLSSYVKRKGKKAVVMAGPTQLLFGIKGKRWDDNPMINKFYNDNWIRPNERETPAAANKVEGGCYW